MHFSRFCLRLSELMSKYIVGLKTLLQEGVSQPKFNNSNAEKLLAKLFFSEQCKMTATRYKEDRFQKV